MQPAATSHVNPNVLATPPPPQFFQSTQTHYSVPPQMAQNYFPPVLSNSPFVPSDNFNFTNLSSPTVPYGMARQGSLGMLGNQNSRPVPTYPNIPTFPQNQMPQHTSMEMHNPMNPYQNQLNIQPNAMGQANMHQNPFPMTLNVNTQQRMHPTQDPMAHNFQRGNGIPTGHMNPPMNWSNLNPHPNLNTNYPYGNQMSHASSMLLPQTQTQPTPSPMRMMPERRVTRGAPEPEWHRFFPSSINEMLQQSDFQHELVNTDFMDQFVEDSETAKFWKLCFIREAWKDYLLGWVRQKTRQPEQMMAKEIFQVVINDVLRCGPVQVQANTLVQMLIGILIETKKLHLKRSVGHTFYEIAGMHVI